MGEVALQQIVFSDCLDLHRTLPDSIASTDQEPENGGLVPFRELVVPPLGRDTQGIWGLVLSVLYSVFGVQCACLVFSIHVVWFRVEC